MKNLILAVTAAAGLSGMSAAFAGTDDIMASNNQAGLQIISTHVDYTETGNGILGSPTGTLDTEQGSVPGFAVSKSQMKDLWLGNDYIEAEYDRASGNTSYVGGLLGPPSTPYGSVTGTSGATLINYSARFGAGFKIDEQSMLTPYLEIGHHEWDRGVNTGETYTNGYYGFGVLGQYSSVDGLVLSANVLLGETFVSGITVNPVPVPGGNGFSGALGNSGLYRIGAGADYLFAQNLHATFGVDYTSFSYGISGIYPVGGNYVAWEPDSKTKYTTVKIGLGYGL